MKNDLNLSETTDTLNDTFNVLQLQFFMLNAYNKAIEHNAKKLSILSLSLSQTETGSRISQTCVSISSFCRRICSTFHL